MRTLAFAALLAASVARLDAQGRAIVAVALSDVDSIAIFDANSLARLATLAVGKNPHEIAASRDGRTLYVANARGSSISVFDVSSQPRPRATWRLPDSISVHDIAVADDGMVWAVSGTPPVLFGIDTSNGSVQHRYALERDGSWMVAAQGPDDALVVASMEGGAVSLVRADGRQTIYNAAPGQIDAEASRDRTQIWSVNYQSGELTVFESRSGRILTRLPAGPEPTRVIFTPDGTTALVPLGGDSTVVAYDVATQTQTGAVTVGAGPKVIALSTNGKRAYVTHPRGALTVFDVASMKVLRSIPLAGTPDGVAVAGARESARGTSPRARPTSGSRAKRGEDQRAAGEPADRELFVDDPRVATSGSSPVPTRRSSAPARCAEPRWSENP